MEHPISLSGLTPREAVADALQRAVTALDENDHALFESAFVQDENTAFVLGDKTVQGWKAVDEYMTSNIFTISTTHFVSGLRVHLQSDTTASMTAHAQAFHYPPAEAFQADNQNRPFVSAGIYYVDLVKDSRDGLWKMTKWTLNLKWVQGDAARVFGPN